MIRQAKKYPSKILLFGEYAVLGGADALAVPFPHFHGQWAWLEEGRPSEAQQSLPDFQSFLAEGDFPGFQVAAMRNALDEGLYFQSNIPTGYGAGSSGALCAAVYDAFMREESPALTLGERKRLFARMEGFFHGSSSGFDPLVSHAGEAMCLSDGEIQAIIPPPRLQGLFLVDTQQARQAGEYIRIFKEKQQDARFQKALQGQFVPLTQAAIQSLLAPGHPGLAGLFRDISHFQHQFFREMIPASILPLWEKGLRDASYSLKICGAGGGGFLLGYSKDWQATRTAWAGWGLFPLWESTQ